MFQLSLKKNPFSILPTLHVHNLMLISKLNKYISSVRLFVKGPTVLCRNPTFPARECALKISGRANTFPIFFHSYK